MVSLSNHAAISLLQETPGCHHQIATLRSQ